VATADGPAEIEFEHGSKLYLAENSVLLFRTLTTRDGAPSTEMEPVDTSPRLRRAWDLWGPLYREWAAILMLLRPQCKAMAGWMSPRRTWDRPSITVMALPAKPEDWTIQARPRIRTGG